MQQWCRTHPTCGISYPHIDTTVAANDVTSEELAREGGKREHATSTIMMTFWELGIGSPGGKSPIWETTTGTGGTNYKLQTANPASGTQPLIFLLIIAVSCPSPRRLRTGHASFTSPNQRSSGRPPTPPSLALSLGRKSSIVRRDGWVLIIAGSRTQQQGKALVVIAIKAFEIGARLPRTWWPRGPGLDRCQDRLVAKASFKNAPPLSRPPCSPSSCIHILFVAWNDEREVAQAGPSSSLIPGYHSQPSLCHDAPALICNCLDTSEIRHRR